MMRLGAPLRVLCAAALFTAPAMLVTTPAFAESSPAKKELVARIVQLQMPGIELIAQSLVERPAALMLKDAGQAVQKRVAANRRDAAGKRIQDSARRYLEETSPLVRARAVSLAPQVFGPQLESNFSEAELTQLLAWLESPLARKYHQAMPAVQDSFMQQLVADARPLVDPKLLRLEQDIRSAIGLPPVDDKPMPRAPAADPAAKNK